MEIENLKGLLIIRKMDTAPNVTIEICVEWRRMWMKGVMKVFSGCLTTLKEWGKIELLKGRMLGCVGSRLVSRPR